MVRRRRSTRSCRPSGPTCGRTPRTVSGSTRCLRSLRTTITSARTAASTGQLPSPACKQRPRELQLAHHRTDARQHRQPPRPDVSKWSFRPCPTATTDYRSDTQRLLPAAQDADLTFWCARSSRAPPYPDCALAQWPVSWVSHSSVPMPRSLRPWLTAARNARSYCSCWTSAWLPLRGYPLKRRRRGSKPLEQWSS